jgi:hypothetical protein
MEMLGVCRVYSVIPVYGLLFYIGEEPRVCGLRVPKDEQGLSHSSSLLKKMAWHTVDVQEMSVPE